METENVLGLYADIFSCTLREAADQLRDRAALEAALPRPRNYARDGSADISLQAAVLAHGIAETQPFVEGNKRTALAAMLTFIGINGYEVRASQQSLADWIIRPSDDLDANGLARLLRQALRPADIGIEPAEGDLVE